VVSLFPTLKRGANKLRASGAFVRTLHMQLTIELGAVAALDVQAESRTLQNVGSTGSRPAQEKRYGFFEESVRLWNRVEDGAAELFAEFG
jgi:hypothetical protein